MRLRSFAVTFAPAPRRALAVMPPTLPTSLRQRSVHVVAALCAAWPVFALAQVKIGLVLSLTGPAASLGIPARDTAAMLPKTMGGQKVEYIVLDDASDTTQAVQDTKKLISEDHVDAIIGSSITPNTLVPRNFVTPCAMRWKRRTLWPTLTVSST